MRIEDTHCHGTEEICCSKNSVFMLTADFSEFTILFYIYCDPAWQIINKTSSLSQNTITITFPAVCTLWLFSECYHLQHFTPLQDHPLSFLFRNRMMNPRFICYYDPVHNVTSFLVEHPQQLVCSNNSLLCVFETINDVPIPF